MRPRPDPRTHGLGPGRPGKLRRNRPGRTEADMSTELTGPHLAASRSSAAAPSFPPPSPTLATGPLNASSSFSPPSSATRTPGKPTPVPPATSSPGASRSAWPCPPLTDPPLAGPGRDGRSSAVPPGRVRGHPGPFRTPRSCSRVPAHRARGSRRGRVIAFRPARRLRRADGCQRWYRQMPWARNHYTTFVDIGYPSFLGPSMPPFRSLVVG